MQARVERHVVDGCNSFHAAIEIARHPVGRAEKKLVVTAIRKVKKSRVLEEPPDDAHHSDAIAHPRNTRPQTADAAYDEVDLDAGL